MTGRRLTVVLAVLCLSAVAASAEWQRTVWLADTLTPDQGKLQLEIWGLYGSAADGDYTDMTLSPSVYYGLRDNWSIEGRLNYLSYDVEHGPSESGLADSGLRTRYRFLEEAKSAVDLAALAYVSLPTGDEDKGLGSGNVDPGVGLSAAKTLGKVVLVAEATYDRITDADEGEEDGIFYAGLEGAYMVSDRLNINAFIDTATARLKDGDDSSQVGLGARFLPKDQWELLGAWSYGLTDSSPDWTVNVAVGYEF